MPRKSNVDVFPEPAGIENPTPLSRDAVVDPLKLWTVVSWKDVRDVFRCSKCGDNRDELDEMIIHAVSHFPVEEQYDVLERLLKETNNG